MPFSRFFAITLLAVANGLRVPGVASSSSSSRLAASSTRRNLLAGAAALALSPLPALANTQPDLLEPMTGFEAGAEKRKAFMENQKKFKKAWRRELSNLEFATTDQEAIDATDNLYKLISQNNFEVPEGVRKMDLDQVYKSVKDKLGKGARMNFQKVRMRPQLASHVAASANASLRCDPVPVPLSVRHGESAAARTCC